MLAMMLAILSASLLGSLHCAGMCGGFLAMAVSPVGEDEARRVPGWGLNASYNLGRLATYVMLGAIAGAAGKGLDVAGDMAGVQRLAAVCAGAWMVVFGGVMVARVVGVRVPRLPLPGVLKNTVMRGYSVADRLGPLGRAGVIGLLTTLLPCGWLYAFAATAAGTGSPGAGALAMGVFWVGTLPVMASLGLALQRSLGPVRRVMPLMTAVVLIVMGGLTLAGRVRLIPVPGEAAPRAVCNAH